MSALSLTLLAVVLAAMWTDVRFRRIPNGLTVTALVAALVLRLILGATALLDGMLGAGLALVLVMPLFALGGVGGGDAKLLVAVGAFLGPKGFLVALLATAIAGGVMSLAWTARRGVILPALLNTRGLLKYVITAGRRGERTTLAMPGAVSIPYGVAIAAGAIFALWFAAA
ncbi:MAG TPA: prepilin peptidase [Longimicrobiales bacterium]|nr:prepilin peptidase [Longimicrobiales bacterium]